MSEENASEEVIEETPQDSIENEEQDVNLEDNDSSNMLDKDFPESTAKEKEFSSDAENEEDLQKDISDALDDGAEIEDIKNMVKEFKLKVNGEEVVKKYDLSDDSEVDKLKRDLQMGEANKQGMQRAKELERMYTQELNRLKSEPWKVLEEMGLDPMEMAESKINDYIEEKKKSPEQLEKENMQKELEEARAELKRGKETAEAAAFAKLQEEEATKIESEIEEVLTAHKTLPKSRKTVSRIADALLWAMDNGFENASVADVVPMVEDEIRQEMREFMDILGETDMLEEYIGHKNIDKMRSKRIAKAKSNNLSNIKSTSKAADAAKAEQAPKERIKMDEFFRNL